jgi:hypothetical protein
VKSSSRKGLSAAVLAKVRLLVCPSATAHVILSKSGQKTPTPHVHISVGSRRGSAGIMTEPDTEQGNAKIKMYGETYSNILGVPLTDKRAE